ncbi:hypothetical protein ACLB1E_37005 [Escherichia coli]
MNNQAVRKAAPLRGMGMNVRARSFFSPVFSVYAQSEMTLPSL